jgi:hypothetical protein
MNTDLLDTAFAALIKKRGVHNALGVEDNYVQQLRYKLKNGLAIRTDTKLRLLQKSGWRQDDRIYNRKDLIGFINFYNRTSQAARELGPEYVIQKWERKRIQNRE